MTFKGNPEKKDVFIKFNLKETLSLTSIIIPFLIVLSVFIAYVYSSMLVQDYGDNSKKMFLIIMGIFLLASVFIIFVFIPFICYLTTKKIAAGIGDWELDIQDNYAVLKNGYAVTTISFADFKSYVVKQNSITYKIGLVKRTYICWEMFQDSENLKQQLLNIGEKIGQFEKVDPLSPDGKEIKTDVQFNKKKTNLATYLIIMAFVIILEILINRYLK